jgi:hypothetical protein
MHLIFKSSSKSEGMLGWHELQKLYEVAKNRTAYKLSTQQCSTIDNASYHIV